MLVVMNYSGSPVNFVFCRNLRLLLLEESSIIENDSKWLHELALNNTVLETLNFYLTYITVKTEDLALLAKNCPNLVSVKLTDCEFLDLVYFFRHASALEEFCGGTYNEEPEKYSAVSLPAKLCQLGLTYIGKSELPIVFTFTAALKKLDLVYALLDTEDHCMLIQKCPNLEVLEVKFQNFF
jgi:coronatine-insensitive protein 1